MGEQVSDDIIEDVILRGLPKEYDLLRQQSHSDRAFDLQKIKSTSCYIVLICKAPISFKTRQHNLTAMSTMETELVAGAPATKEAVFCSNMMKELGFGT